jgi:hypothetical protein
MALRTRLNRRLAIALVLAVVLAGEVTGLTLAVRLPSTTVPASATETASGLAANAARDHSPAETTTPVQSAQPAFSVASRSAVPAQPVVAPTVKSAPKAKAVARTSQPKAQAPVAHRGRNHVWIPALGINRSVSSFPCARSRPPDNYVYRWGCAGTNNVYLLGHAYSVFKPLHDAYVGGRLKKGMKVFYADGSGHVRTYSVIWWKVTPPTSSASWAWAAQSRPSMTLQTCLGAHSEYRLVVRLVAVG